MHDPRMHDPRMTDAAPGDLVRLSAVLDLLGSSVLAAAEGGPEHDPPVSESVLWDPMDGLPPVPGGILLLVGGSPTNPLLGETLVEAGRLGYTGAVIKRRSADLSSTAALAGRAGLALLVTSDDISWGTLDSLLSGAITSQRGAATVPVGHTASGDLFALANAIAAIADAAITIEDVGRHVLAYSNLAGHTIDASRRDSILGRLVPGLPEYLAEYQAMARSSGAVFFSQDDGTLARVAMPIRVSGRLLGSIWAIDETGQDGDQIAEILTQIAPTAALHLLRSANTGDLDRQRRAELLAAQLGVANSPGGETTASLRDRLPVALLGFGPLRDGGGTLDEHRLTSIIALNAETVCREASCARVDEAIFVLLPSAQRFSPARLDQLARSTLRAVTIARPLGARICCAYAPRIESTAAVADARMDVTTALRAMWQRDGLDVVDVVEQRHIVLMQKLAESGLGHTDQLIGAVRAILGHDQEHQTAYATTLLAHLECSGDARRAAARLGVHANSQRYRMRRVVQQFGVDLDDPELRLVLWLQLRIVCGTPRGTGGVTYPR
jgi:DNA-binding PucR family transcriptional regulator